MSDLTNHDLIGKTVKDLVPSVYETIDDLNQQLEISELNICDKCGIIESTYTLIWLEYLEDIENDKAALELAKTCVAVCDDCYKKETYRKI